MATLYQYDSMANAWEALASMSTSRSRPAAAAIDGKLYVMGGYDGQNRLSSVERYDPAKNEWVASASMALGAVTSSHCAVSIRCENYELGKSSGPRTHKPEISG